MGYRFTDLVDIDSFRGMMESFYAATGILHGIVDADNNVISAVGWERACTEFHRAFPLSKERCEESNRELSAKLGTEGYVGVKCHNGLMDYACPIIIEGEQMATLYFGQILHEPPDLEFFRKQAKECGYDEEAYLAAIREVPVMSRDRVDSIMAFFSQLAQMLAQSGLIRIRAKAAEASLAELNKELNQGIELRTKELEDKNLILEQIAQGDPLPLILNSLILSVELEDPSIYGSILLLDSEGKHLHNGAAPSLPDFYNEAVDGIEIGEAVGSCGSAAYTRKRVVVSDIQTHPYWAKYRELASKAGLAACWSEPFFSSSGKLLGTFAIYHKEPSEPTPLHLKLIGQASNLASIAVEHYQALDELEHQAHTDSLTGLSNRGHFMEMAEIEQARSHRTGKSYGMLLIDIDLFKEINDQYGHEAGDLVLQALAGILMDTLREIDITGRLGGDEFTVLLPDVDREEVMDVAERLRKDIAKTEISISDEQSLQITVSIGIALHIDITEEIQTTLHKADEALYQAKNSGRNQVCILGNP
jgi:diguanylate cyclase (GGDEF)-like protein